MAAKVSVRKIDSTVGGIDNFISSVEIIILALKEHMTTFLEDTTSERITVTMVTGKSPLK